MREYNNYDNKTNDEESDPCIAAEVRMKKSTLSARTRRNLIALLIILAIIASLSVLLFLILPRSKETSEGVRAENYVVFDVPPETSTAGSFSPAVIHSSKETDQSAENMVALHPGAVLLRESESRDVQTSSKESVLEDDLLTSAKLEDDEITSAFPTALPGDTTQHSKTLLTTPAKLTASSETYVVPAATTTVTATAEERSTEQLPTPVTTGEQQFTGSTAGTVGTDKTLKLTVSGGQKSTSEGTPAAEVLNMQSASETTTVTGTPLKLSTEASVKPSEKSPEMYSPMEVLNLTSAGEAQDCEEFFARGTRTDGIYSISSPKVGKFDVVCDMATEPGGWNVIQRRQDASVFFDNRTWEEYEHGFGQLETSFWLGLEKIYALVAKENGRPLTLRIELRGDRCDEGDRCSGLPDGFWFGEWDFRIGDARSSYTLTISPAKAGNLSEHTSQDKFFYMNNGRPFTTVDRDNDHLPTKNCANWRNFGGWWHHDCGYVALNGRYEDTSSRMMHLFWHYWSSTRNGSRQKLESYHIKPRFTEMKIRRRQ